MEREISEACGADAVSFLDATKLATRLMGDSIATNLFVLGYAWQKGAGAGAGGDHPARD